MIRSGIAAMLTALFLEVGTSAIAQDVPVAELGESSPENCAADTGCSAIDSINREDVQPVKLTVTTGFGYYATPGGQTRHVFSFTEARGEPEKTTPGEPDGLPGAESSLSIETDRVKRVSLLAH